MRRRQFIAALGSAAAWPFAARAQPVGKLPAIGFLGTTSAATWTSWTAAFLQRLRELGWVEDRTVTIEFCPVRWSYSRSLLAPLGRTGMPAQCLLSGALRTFDRQLSATQQGP